jgi:3-oxoacyl-[acyl-carrier-protein] synthase II
MIQKRVVITGIGVLSACGIGRDSFSQAILSGNSGIKPISLFETKGFSAKAAGEIKDFSPEQFLGAKGLRTLDRSTKLVASATKLALDDARLKVTDTNTQEIGVVVGTTLGSLSSISGFDKESLIEGPRYVNPALFANTVINSPASQVSIKFAIKGFNATLSTGFTASLDVLNYASDFIKLGRASAVCAGGVEELCFPTYLGFYKAGLLSGQDLSCPFDKHRNGLVLGEGSAILVLEDLDSAMKRNARIYAEVKGFGSSFDVEQFDKYSGSGRGLIQAMRLSLICAGLKKIDYICAAANSSPDADAVESAAIKEVFPENSAGILVSSIKSATGECFSASGSLQAAAAVVSLESQMVPPTVNYQDKDPRCDLNIVAGKAVSAKIDTVMVNAFGPSGCNSSLILTRFN